MALLLDIFLFLWAYTNLIVAALLVLPATRSMGVFLRNGLFFATVSFHLYP
jgi:hypothetical protein